MAMAPASASTLIAGILIDWWGGPATIPVLSGIMSISAVAATFSKGMRGMRPLA